MTVLVHHEFIFKCEQVLAFLFVSHHSIYARSAFLNRQSYTFIYTEKVIRCNILPVSENGENGKSFTSFLNKFCSLPIKTTFCEKLFVGIGRTEVKFQ